MSADQVQDLAPATARPDAGPGAGADAGAGAGTLPSNVHGTIRANAIRRYNSDAWDDCSVKLDRESEAWADCGESFQDSLGFKKGTPSSAWPTRTRMTSGVGES